MSLTYNASSVTLIANVTSSNGPVTGGTVTFTVTGLAARGRSKSIQRGSVSVSKQRGDELTFLSAAKLLNKPRALDSCINIGSSRCRTIF